MQIITTFVYCAGADLHLLVNNNMLTQKGSCIITKMLVKSICLEAIAGVSIIMLITQVADFA